MPKTKNKESKSYTMTIEEKLFETKLRPNTESHITVNDDFCILCKGKECTKFCPSNVFSWSIIDDELIVAYENCLECGACNIGCPYKAIDFTYPKPPHGVAYRNYSPT